MKKWILLAVSLFVVGIKLSHGKTYTYFHCLRKQKFINGTVGGWNRPI